MNPIESRSEIRDIQQRWDVMYWSIDCRTSDVENERCLVPFDVNLPRTTRNVCNRPALCNHGATLTATEALPTADTKTMIARQASRGQSIDPCTTSHDAAEMPKMSILLTSSIKSPTTRVVSVSTSTKRRTSEPATRWLIRSSGVRLVQLSVVSQQNDEREGWQAALWSRAAVWFCWRRNANRFSAQRARLKTPDDWRFYSSTQRVRFPNECLLYFFLRAFVSDILKGFL